MDRKCAVEWTQIDGVDVAYGSEPGPLRASLAFRIGKTDEYLHANGITHLAEHLALHAMGQPPHYQNGAVTTCVTTFETVGDDEQVVDFLRHVTEALGSLPGDRLEDETRVLEVEATQRHGGLVPWLYMWRYGSGGPGLWGYDEYAIRTCEPSSVQQWADYVFRAGNAVLTLSAPPPAGLRLNLPPGGRLEVPALVPMLPAAPAQFEMDRPQLGGVALLTRSVAASAYVDVAQRRLVERLRRDLAVSYSPAAVYDRYDRTTAHLLMAADIHPDHLGAATKALHEVITELAKDGPTQIELDAYLADARRAREQIDTASAAQMEAMGRLLSGSREPWDTHLDEIDLLVPGDLVAPASEARDSMLYAVPRGHALPEHVVAMAPLSSLEPPVVGRSLTRAQGTPSGEQLEIGPDGVNYTWAIGTRSTVRYATCRATLAWSDGARVLIAPDGTTVAVDPRRWVEARDIIADVDAATAEVMVPMQGVAPVTRTEPAPSPDGGRLSRLFLTCVLFFGAVLFLLVGIDKTTKPDDRAVELIAAALCALGGSAMARNLWRTRR